MPQTVGELQIHHIQLSCQGKCRKSHQPFLNSTHAKGDIRRDRFRSGIPAFQIHPGRAIHGNDRNLVGVWFEWIQARQPPPLLVVVSPQPQARHPGEGWNSSRHSINRLLLSLGQKSGSSPSLDQALNAGHHSSPWVGPEWLALPNHSLPVPPTPPAHPPHYCRIQPSAVMTFWFISKISYQ